MQVVRTIYVQWAACSCFFSLGSDGTLRAKVQPFTVAVRSRLTSFTTPFVGWICGREERKEEEDKESVEEKLESSGGRGRGEG